MAKKPEVLPAPVAPHPAPRSDHVEEFSHEILIWDEENPRSLINLVKPNGKFKQLCLDAKFEKEEFFGLDEQRLYTALRAQNATPSPSDNRLRYKLWFEYDYAQQFVTDIDLRRVCAGVLEMAYFLQKYCSHPLKLAWLLCPPQNYMIKATEALEFGLEQMRNILAQDHLIGIEGQGCAININVAKLKIEIFKILDLRVKGAPTQKTMNLHAHTGNKQVAAQITGHMLNESMDQMKDRLYRLQQEQALLQNGGALGIKPPETTE